MNISGITTCVGYAGLLEQGIARWKAGLDRVAVMTSPADSDTVDLCVRERVTAISTVAFKRDGAAFNKAAAMEDGLALSVPNDWVLFFDADIVPPPDWRAQLESHAPTPGNLYGARRIKDTRRAIWDGELAGFFQLWHVSDPVAQDRPLLGSWQSAGSYDSEFMFRWEPERRIILPLAMVHLGEDGRNWCGVGNSAGMERLIAERRRRGGYRHERLDRAVTA